jgi:carbon monoxide dehydrogenase subunit G
MFQVKAGYDGQLDVRAGLERARDFFSNWRNFVELMPNLESITPDARGILRWVIRAEVPVIGAMRVGFPVTQTNAEGERIEWSPAANEQKNLLRCATSFETHAASNAFTRIRIALRVELRRQSARELHTLAGLVGASRLSSEMQKRVNEMMRVFLERARLKLENLAAEESA